MKTNRNDPCPCGSGKKYKKCCLGGTSDSVPDYLQDILAEVREKFASGELSSRDEAQELLSDFMNRKNSAPLTDFQGLSSAQMYRFLHFPFDSPDLARFSDNIKPPLDVPVIRLFSLLIDAIGEKGLKTTATGNLPQKFCRESALAFWGEVKYQNKIKIFSLRTEPEFQEMHALRIVAELAGIIRKYKGKFILAAKFRKVVAESGPGAVYFELFKAYVQQFNWAYLDGYPEFDFPRQAFLFTLYLLQKYGGKTRLQTFYEDIFLAAFPQLPEEVDERPYMSAEEIVRRSFSNRSLANFAVFFGLIESTPTSKDYLNRQYEIKKLPLLDQLVTFTV
ncbi:MAG: SEC-C domain-containing protein [Proteobacteria bacterium]|nr:SEC-C domain-containing protein [Pseudomonadota bacterium]MBU1716501.1 SEC-C domain-containing protein [Pseudomonadota bacterium]